MYRASHDTLFETIARLEQELRELRALGAPRRPRDHVLWGVTVLSVAVAVFAGVAAGASHTHAEALARNLEGTFSRLDTKTRALRECEALAEDQQNAVQQRKIEVGEATHWAGTAFALSAWGEPAR